MGKCTKDARGQTAKAERAIRKYGTAACAKALAKHEEGYGAAGILHGVDCGFAFKTVGQVDAAINAGRWMKLVGFDLVVRAGEHA